MARTRVVIIGGGFGGLSAASAFKRADVDVLLIDRTNHHLFQPLLYQVATTALAPSDITAPIRWILRAQKNVTTLLGTVERIDRRNRSVHVKGEVDPIHYDYLIVATGTRHAYFGHDEWETWAPGLKSVEDARRIRKRFLLAFERAEWEEDEAARLALLTFVIVGGGPTGVELAGVLPEMCKVAFRPDFRRIDTTQVRVILLEGGPRILPSFPESLSARAKRDLERLGVEVRTDTKVTHIDEQGVDVGTERIPSQSVFWAAGNAASPLGKTLDVPLDAAGRVIVEPDLTIPGDSRVFVIGDLSAVKRDAERYVPSVAPAANQMGSWAVRNILALVAGGTTKPFKYVNKGELATIGRHKAIASLGDGKVRITGYAAWFFWLLLHIAYLVGFRNRISVLLQWAYNYIFFERGVRLITETEDASMSRHPATIGRTAEFERVTLPTSARTTSARTTSARTTLALLFLINLLNFYDRQILAAVTEPIRLEFGLSDSAIGWLGTAFTLFYAAVGLPLGRLSDRGSRAKLLGWGVAVWSACTAASGLAFNYWSLFVARLGVGFGEASCSPASHSLIGDLFPSAKRARALSLFMLGLPIGIFLSGVGSGLIAKAWGWRAAFLVALLPGLLLAFLISRIVEPARGSADAAADASADAAANAAIATAPRTATGIMAPYLELWRIPTLRWIVLSGALHNFNAYAVNAFMPALLIRYHGLGLANANIVAAITLGLVGVVALLAGGSLADRARARRPDGRLLLGAVALAAAAPCVYFALALAPGAIVPFMVLMGLGWMGNFLYYATVYASVHDVVPAHLRGTAMAVYFFWMYVLGGAFGTAILGMLSDRFAQRAMDAAGSTVLTDAVRATGLHDAFMIVPIILAALALVLFAASRTVERDIMRAR